MSTAAVSGSRRHSALDVALGVGVVACAVVLFGLMFARLHYGVDQYDESFYAALPYTFTLGHLPFIDEQHIIQLAGLLTWPLVKAYVAVVGDATGLVLFLREAWLVFVAAVAGASFAALRRLMRWELALLVALLPVAAVPFNIPSLSYNTMGSQLMLLGVALGAHHVVLGDRRRWLYFGGVAHGLACVAYPTLAVAVIAFAAALAAIYRRSALRPLLAYLGGAATIGAALGAFFLVVGIGNVRAAFAYTSSLAGYIGAGGAKLHRIVFGLNGKNGLVTVMRWSRVGLAALLLAGAWVLVRMGREWGRLLVPLAALPLLMATSFPLTVRTLGVIILFGFFAILLGPLVAWDSRAVRLWAWAAVPPFLAGFVTAYTSTNGFMNWGVGIVPAVLAFGALLVLATRPEGKLLRVWLLAGVLVAALGALTIMQWRIVYHDAPWRDEKALVTEGPYRGLHTSPNRAKDLASFLALVRHEARPGDSVIFFNQLPSAYLFSTMRPDTNAIWLSLSDDKLASNPTMAYFRRTGRLPTLAFVRRYQPGDHVAVLPDNPLLQLFAAPRYEMVHDERSITVWREMRR